MLPLLSLIPAAGRIIGGIAGGNAEGRLSEAELGQNADKIALDRARLSQDQNDSSIGLDIDQRRYADESNNRSQRKALLASLLSGVRDYQMQLPPELEPYRVQSTGGMRPSSMGNREDISRLIMEQALSELENPMESGGINREAAPVAAAPERPLNKVEMRTGRQSAPQSSDIGASQVVSEQSAGRRLPQINLANIPGASATPQSGLLDKILSGLSIGGSLVGAATGGAKPAGQPAGGVSVPGNPADILRRAGVRF